MIVALAVVLPVLYGLGLAARQSIPPMQELPGELRSSLPKSFVSVSQREDLRGDARVRLIIARDESAPERYAVAVGLLDDVERADLLAYWSEAAGNEGRLPGDARLLGAIGGRRGTSWILPADADLERGRLVLYSLAKHEVVKVMAP